MNRIFAAAALILGLSGGVCRATDAIYQNYGYVTNPPSVDATNFYNQGTFTNFITTLPWDTQNTLYFTNRGIMSGSCGFRFDDASPTGRKAAAVFNNHGNISGLDDGVLFSGQAFGGVFGGSLTTLASYALVSATNIINDGVLSVGDVGLLRLTGKNINLTRGALVAGNLSDQASSIFNLASGNFFFSGSAYINPIGVDDVYWGVNAGGKLDLTLLNGQQPTGEPLLTTPPETVFLPGGLVSSVSLPNNFTNFANGFGFKAFFYQQNPLDTNTEFSYTLNGTNHYINIVFVTTNFSDPAITADVRFSTAFTYFPSNTGGVDIHGVEDVVQFGITNTDVITGLPTTNAIYLLDTGAIYKTMTLVTNAASPNSIARPIAFAVATATPFEWQFGTSNTLPYVAANEIYPGNVFNKQTVDYTSGSYGVQVGRNPESGDGLTSNTNNFFLTDPYLTLADPTNQAGRIEVTADNLDLTQSRIRAEGILMLKAKHLKGNGSAGVDVGIVNADLASTNGFLTISNILPSHFKRVRGDIFAWSANWQNTETNATFTNVINYHVLVVDSALKANYIPTTRHLSLKATNAIDLEDTMNVVRSSLFDTTNLTINNVLGLSETGGAWHAANIPHLKNLLIGTNGAIVASDDLNIGFDTVNGLDTITNRGIIISAAPLLKATIVENAGVIDATNGGSIVIESRTLNLTNLANTNNSLLSPDSQITADRDITLYANNLAMVDTTINAGQTGGPGQLSFTVTNSLTDFVPGIPGTNNVLTNFVSTTDGLILQRKPVSGDLFGTKIRTMATNLNQPLHIWAGVDRGGTNNAGYVDNVVIGHLTLDRQTMGSSLRFTGEGDKNAMYVDFLELADFSYTDYKNGFLIDPNLTIYFAAANVDALKLMEVYSNRLVWVQNFAGPNSTTNVSLIDGTTFPMNIALATSPDIDSDGDGIPNKYDPYPLGDQTAASAAVKLTTLYSSSKSGDVTTLTVTSSAGGSVISVAPSLAAASVATNRPYQLTAVAQTGYLFAGWSGSISALTNKLSIVLQSNMLLHANFIPNPYIPRKGSYNGLFSDDNGVTLTNAGFVTLTVSDKGAITGRLLLSGANLPFTGQFDVNGNAQAKVARPVKALTLQLHLDVTGNSGQLTGTVTDGTWTASLLADYAPVGTSPFAGKYTLALPGSTNGPVGDGYATVTVSAAGIATVSGKLADNSTFSQSVPLSATGHWPLYVTLSGGRELALGWMQLTGEASGLDGSVTWISSPMPRVYYPAGFAEVITVIGSRYTPPAAHHTGLTLINPVVFLTGGGLPLPPSTAVLVDTNRLTIASADKSVVLTLSVSAGTFTGQILNPATKRAVAATGVLLQKQNGARGLFLGVNQSGEVLLQSQ